MERTEQQQAWSTAVNAGLGSDEYSDLQEDIARQEAERIAEEERQRQAEAEAAAVAQQTEQQLSDEPSNEAGRADNAVGRWMQDRQTDVVDWVEPLFR